LKGDPQATQGGSKFPPYAPSFDFCLQRTKEGNGNVPLSFLFGFCYSAPNKVFLVFVAAHQTTLLPSPSCFFFGYNKPKKATVIAVVTFLFFFGSNEPKKAMTILLSSPFFLVATHQRLFCFLCSSAPKKATITLLSSPSCFFSGYNKPNMAMATTLMSPSFLFFGCT
jgi:hypothetical protein